ncbi:hypothetical protein BZG36_00019 [Bifiguratus adelaidae]|uniref:Template-activating factor I n=1 Tax=Bifiguratus adelaidae TaxID=1938954 RepID=A0A261Y9B6_9FUNG|nr:hypothetical protein BZG36_00019 [Bifiguratus adelaidae]
MADNKLTPQQQALSALDKEIEAAERELAKKRYELYKPIHAKRHGIIADIPDFWPTAFGNHPIVGSMIMGGSGEALEQLKDFRVDRDDANPQNYKITLTFGDNPHFKGGNLVKEVKTNEDGTVQVTKTKIEWHDGNEPSKRKREQEEEEDEDEELLDFFDWLESDERAEIAQLLADDLWEDAVDYYNAIDEDDDGIIDLEDEDLEEEEEEEEEEDDAPPKKKQQK